MSKDVMPTQNNHPTNSDEKKQEFDKEQIDEIINKAPPELKGVLQQIFAVGFSSNTQTSQLISPSSRFLENLSNKMESSHIEKIIDNADIADKREFNFNILLQIRNVLFLISGIGVFIWITLFLAKENVSLYQEIIKSLLTFLGGFGLGFGVKSYKKQKK